jgi:hypothetical protein
MTRQPALVFPDLADDEATSPPYRKYGYRLAGWNTPGRRGECRRAGTPGGGGPFFVGDRRRIPDAPAVFFRSRRDGPDSNRSAAILAGT